MFTTLLEPELLTASSLAEPRQTSSLVNRLVRARDDAVKLRARHWLLAMEDAKLLAFGLSRQDIAELRGYRIPG